MKAPITIQQAGEEDAKALQEALWPDSTHWTIEAMLRHIKNQNGRGHSAIALLHGHIVGYGQVMRWIGAAEISELVVVPLHRGKGIGTALIDHLCWVAAGWGERTVEIGAREANVLALNLYERLGFQRQRVIFADVGQGREPIVYLRKPLGATDESASEDSGVPPEPG
jgi:ribosomal protein S18 acetylase RimI-like enzyme